jgi:hypothetical protein
LLDGPVCQHNEDKISEKIFYSSHFAVPANVLIQEPVGTARSASRRSGLPDAFDDGSRDLGQLRVDVRRAGTTDKRIEERPTSFAPAPTANARSQHTRKRNPTGTLPSLGKVKTTKKGPDDQDLSP